MMLNKIKQLTNTLENGIYFWKSVKRSLSKVEVPRYKNVYFVESETVLLDKVTIGVCCVQQQGFC